MFLHLETLGLIHAEDISKAKHNATVSKNIKTGLLNKITSLSSNALTLLLCRIFADSMLCVSIELHQTVVTMNLFCHLHS